MKDESSTKSEWIRSVLDRYSGPLTRFAMHITGDLDRARDIVQDTFIRLCAEEQAQVEEKIAEWLFTVCRNRALNVQRKEKRMEPLTPLHMESCVSRDHSPAAQVERQESADQILTLVKTLPENQQEVLRLKFQNDLSYKEISQITSLSVSNVGFLIHTAIKALRQQLKKQGDWVPET